MLKIRVENMLSPRGNREVPNQFIIRTDDGIYFQSYNTIICAKIKGQVYLESGEDHRFDWEASTTTGKYRNQFLGEGIEETRKKIKSGEYILTNLN